MFGVSWEAVPGKAAGGEGWECSHPSMDPPPTPAAGTAKDKEHWRAAMSLGCPLWNSWHVWDASFSRKWEELGAGQQHSRSGAAAPRAPGAAPQLGVFVRKAQMALLASMKALEEIPKEY